MNCKKLEKKISFALGYIYLHPVKLELIWKPCESSLDEIVDKSKTLTIFSRQNGNTDNSGGCGNLGIPVEEFVWKKECKYGITLKDITEGVYRLKGSKYDLWYELFGSVERDENGIYEVDFGYGS
jgi:hypothetical protein